MRKPNIIVFMTDHQRADTMLPDSKVIKPNIDRFLKRSVNFTEGYCPAPHCCPSRATFFTGLYPTEHGVWHNVEVCNAISRGVYDGVKMFSETLKESGYNMYFSGKWHISAVEGPEHRGFEVLSEYTSNHGRMARNNVPHYEDWEVFYSGKVPIDQEGEEKTFGRIIRPGYPTYYQFGVDENPFGDTDTVEYAVKQLRNMDSEKPYFMYIGTVGPHDPYNVPQRFLDMYDINDIELPDNFYDDLEDRPALYRRTKEQFNKLTEQEHKESILRYRAFCTYEDYLFGKVLDTIDEKGEWDNTVVIYVSDHGDYVGAHGLWAKGLPCFKEAYNICAAIGGGGIEKPGTQNDKFISLADFAPTILQLAGVKSNVQFTGKSLVPFLKGENPIHWRTEMYTQTNGNEIYGIQRAVWNKKWKYVFNSFDYDELYDLENDPLEMNNLINNPGYKDVIKVMCAKIWEFAYVTKDNFTCPYIMVALAPYGPGILEQ